MNPLHRGFLSLAAAAFGAGLASGLVLPEIVAGGEEGGGERSPDEDFVATFAQKYDLDRDQRRTLWMILSARRSEELRFLKNRPLDRSESRELEKIAERADQRILQLLDEDQRTRYLADKQN